MVDGTVPYTGSPHRQADVNENKYKYGLALVAKWRADDLDARDHPEAPFSSLDAPRSPPISIARGRR